MNIFVLYFWYYYSERTKLGYLLVYSAVIKMSWLIQERLKRLFKNDFESELLHETV